MSILLYIVLAIIYLIISSVVGTVTILTYTSAKRKDIVELAELAYNRPDDLSDVTDEDDTPTAADAVALGIVLGFVVLHLVIYIYGVGLNLHWIRQNVTP